MEAEYCGPEASGIDAVNRLLSLPATGREQDWEIEFADPARIGEMISLLRLQSMDIEARSALALLTLWSIDEASELDVIRDRQAMEIREVLAAYPNIRSRMRSYWSHFSPSHIVSDALG